MKPQSSEQPDIPTGQQLPPSKPLFDPDQIYPTVSSPSNPQKQQPLQQNPKRHPKKLLISSCLVVLVVAAGLLIYIFQNNSKKHSTGEFPTKTYSVSGPTAFERKLNSDQLSILHSIKYSMYIPGDQVLKTPILNYNQKTPEKMVLAYSVGSYKYEIYPKNPTYNPPADCGLPQQVKTSSPLSCSLYAQATKSMPAYVYNGGYPGSTQYINTDGSTTPRISLYVELPNNMIGRIESFGTDPSSLYALAKQLKKIEPRELPDSTLLAFNYDVEE